MSMAKKSLGYHNGPPSEDPTHIHTKNDAKAEFARRLQKAMTERGWNQSELARAVSKHTGQPFGRFNVSQYIRGNTLPRPDHLKPLAHVLGVAPHELLPTRGVPRTEAPTPPLDVSDAGNDMAWLRINQRVPWPVAVEIMKLIKGHAND